MKIEQLVEKYNALVKKLERLETRKKFLSDNVYGAQYNSGSITKKKSKEIFVLGYKIGSSAYIDETRHELSGDDMYVIAKALDDYYATEIKRIKEEMETFGELLK
jgi:hypothetical protein